MDKTPVFINPDRVVAMERVRNDDINRPDFTRLTMTTTGFAFLVYETPEEIIRILERAERVGAVEAGR